MMFSGTSGREIDDIKVDYNKSPHVPDYVTVQIWEAGEMGSFHIDMQPEKARELIAKLQAVLPSPVQDGSMVPLRMCEAVSPHSEVACEKPFGHDGPCHEGHLGDGRKTTWYDTGQEIAF